MHLPGRDERLHEPPATNIAMLAAAVREGIHEFTRQPFAIFGHSLGALVGFELARLLAACDRLAPEYLFVSACRPPWSLDGLDPLHGLPDGQFVAAVNARYGTIPEAVAANAELMKLLIPALRADFESVETYRFRPSPPLMTPLFALGGAEDSNVPAQVLGEWRQATGKSFSMRLFSGGHFYLRQAEVSIRELIVSALLGGNR